jgi:hypothetical protein
VICEGQQDLDMVASDAEGIPQREKLVEYYEIGSITSVLCSEKSCVVCGGESGILFSCV